MRTPNGDSIAEQVSHHQSTDTNFSDVAHSLTEAHAHRPGLWQQDLEKTNDALHEKGVLPGMDIVGVKGQDLVTRDSSGNVQLVDSTNITSVHDQGYSAGSTSEIGGRYTTTNADGSGTVTAKRGDSSPWVLSQAVLRSQGIDNPTANQMANYQIELERTNGINVSQIKPGDEIIIPASTRAGDQTDFGGDRAAAQAQADKAAVDKQYDEATAAMNKFGEGTSWLGTNYISRDDIDTAMTRGDLTDADKRGLQFLDKNYDRIASPEGFWAGGVWPSGLDKWKTDSEERIQERFDAP